jgi:hypothetical protein
LGDRGDRAMGDLFQMMQSGTFMHQLGYSVLRIVSVSLFPRLRRVFEEIELGAAPGPAGGMPFPVPPLVPRTRKSPGVSLRRAGRKRKLGDGEGGAPESSSAQCFGAGASQPPDRRCRKARSGSAGGESHTAVERRLRLVDAGWLMRGLQRLGSGSQELRLGSVCEVGSASGELRPGSAHEEQCLRSASQEVQAGRGSQELRLGSAPEEQCLGMASGALRPGSAHEQILGSASQEVQAGGGSQELRLGCAQEEQCLGSASREQLSGSASQEQILGSVSLEHHLGTASRERRSGSGSQELRSGIASREQHRGSAREEQCLWSGSQELRLGSASQEQQAKSARAALTPL